MSVLGTVITVPNTVTASVLSAALCNGALHFIVSQYRDLLVHTQL
jgi:hypothetical protein